ncbi:hypothetical protein EPUS_06588 [Endocarpon pusillum Z07020]|uniref:Amidohydrolase-related domain-containing protein n=1 Tax=Endocarpon pusillum (strain Z07020 / HMAS-L-300199) TaxID=1263415 RepID=U1HUS5_ENDPU|nr:uncharacterized protein EPUS_06588 [Endocarpon pusillum Z07020]ERF74410.1 hypothetical protein EPUS_06588 [Endocarpon pusillum Z07020]
MNTEIHAVHLAHQPPSSIWDVEIKDGKITSVQPSVSASAASPSGKHSILLPSLCHPHIHLDKAFLLSSDYPQYADLAPTAGTFQEALSNTAQAKTRYTRSDLEQRGCQLIGESIKAGVTAMRAFVEVDHVVEFLCLEVASLLKKRFKKACHVQIVAFAQDPIFSSEHGDENRRFLEQALERREEFGIDVLGTTPYVESSNTSHKNIDWAVRKARQHDLHLDFHLDYNLDSSDSDTNTEPKTKTKTKTIALAHCTRLTLLSTREFQDLATRIRDSDLPISLIGLPSSDVYMMGRPTSSSPNPAQDRNRNLSRPLGTLPIPTLIKEFNLNAALSVNNLSNPFTPYGTADPLQLACWGVGMYHAGAEGDAEVLYECVSARGRREGLGVEVGDVVSARGGEDTVVDICDEKAVPGSGDKVDSTVTVLGRGMRSVRDVVWCPPETGRRKVIR